MLSACLAIVSCGFTGSVGSSSQPDGGKSASFGFDTDVAYSSQLWETLSAERIVGDNAVAKKPFFGGAKPHGMILELAYQPVTIGGHTGFVVVKKNYDGDGVSINAVEKNRSKYLHSITVMYQREAGYDEDNQNWFWAKYGPKGELLQKQINGRDIGLAG